MRKTCIPPVKQRPINRVNSQPTQHLLDTQLMCEWIAPRHKVKCLILLGVFFTSITSSLPISAQTEAINRMQADDQPAQSLPNLKIPTLGGKQFWTDHSWRRGWRVQQNAITKHWRLLDESNVRQAWGSREACEQALHRRVPDSGLPHDHVIVLLHGLIRSADSMESLRKALAKENRYSVFSFEYASTRGAIADHAQALREVVAGLPENAKLSFIGHSMGNIVVRHAIGDWQRANAQSTLKRLHSVIMLGPPNQGASIARQLSKIGIFELTIGQGAMELGPRWEELSARLATPPCPFGIVAGELDSTFPKNPLVSSENSDFVVSVDETKLAGATDFITVPRLHSFLMDDPRVQASVSSFLQRHSFQ